MNFFKVFFLIVITSVVLGVIDTYLLTPKLITNAFVLSIATKVIYGFWGVMIYSFIKKDK